MRIYSITYEVWLQVERTDARKPGEKAIGSLRVESFSGPGAKKKAKGLIDRLAENRKGAIL